MNTHSGLSGPLDSSGSYLGPSEVRGRLADEACWCMSQLCLQYATAMGLAGLSTVLMFNRLRGLRFAAQPWNHALGVGFMAFVGYRIGQTNEGVHFWAAAQREAVSKLPSWAAEIAQENGWSTDGMSQAQALAEARRGVLIEDQAAYRAAAAQHRRAVLDGAEAGSFVSAAAPASLPRQDALQFSTFAKSLADSDAQAHASLLKRVQSAALPVPLPPQFADICPKIEEGYQLVGEVCSIVKPALAAGNMQALRAYLSDDNKADGLLAERAKLMLKVATPALQVAHTQLANAQPDSNGDVFIDLPVFCELNAEGALASPVPTIPHMKATSRMHSKYLPQLEQVVQNAKKDLLVCTARAARRTARTAEEMTDERVVAMAQAIAGLSDEFLRLALGTLNPGLMQVFTVALLQHGCTEMGMSLGAMTVDVDHFVQAQLTEDGLGIADPEQLVSAAKAMAAEYIPLEGRDDDASLRRMQLGFAAALVHTTLQSALSERVPPQHRAAIMAEFGWDFQEAAHAAVVDKAAALQQLQEAADTEDTVVASQAAVAEQVASILQEHTQRFVPEQARTFSKGTQRYLARYGLQSSGILALLDAKARQLALEEGAGAKPSQLRANAAKLKEDFMQHVADMEAQR